jgi:uncharacterized protein (TIGR00106 family)
MFSFVSNLYGRLFTPIKSELSWKDRNVVADVSISAIGTDPSMSPHVRTCGEILANNHNLKTTMHAFGTNVEGKLRDIERATEDCIQALHKQGVPRVSTTLTICSRIDKPQSLETRMKSVK